MTRCCFRPSTRYHHGDVHGRRLSQKVAFNWLFGERILNGRRWRKKTSTRLTQSTNQPINHSINRLLYSADNLEENARIRSQMGNRCPRWITTGARGSSNDSGGCCRPYSVGSKHRPWMAPADIRSGVDPTRLTAVAAAAISLRRRRAECKRCCHVGGRCCASVNRRNIGMVPVASVTDWRMRLVETAICSVRLRINNYRFFVNEDANENSKIMSQNMAI